MCSCYLIEYCFKHSEGVCGIINSSRRGQYKCCCCAYSLRLLWSHRKRQQARTPNHGYQYSAKHRRLNGESILAAAVTIIFCIPRFTSSILTSMCSSPFWTFEKRCRVAAVLAGLHIHSNTDYSTSLYPTSRIHVWGYDAVLVISKIFSLILIVRDWWPISTRLRWRRREYKAATNLQIINHL